MKRIVYIFNTILKKDNKNNTCRFLMTYPHNLCLEIMWLTCEDYMKIMNCKQLGGACDKEFHANSFEEIVEMSKQHGMEMFQKNDEAHLKAINKIQQLMQKPEAMSEWFESKKKEFEALPES